MFGPGEERLKRWDLVIISHLNRLDPKTKYIKVNSKVMMGLCICLYGKKDIAGMISEVQAGKVKTGFQGVGENKGAVVVRFNIGQTSVCLMNCHLAHGRSNYRKRFEEIRTIYNARIGNSHQERIIAMHDIKFIFGDLNFRVDLDNEGCCFLARQKNFAELLAKDQLWGQYHQFNFLPSLEECPVAFQPTCKFLKGSSIYDLEKRPPAWCDRILWATSDLVKCTKYSSADPICFSDHKPVFGVYLLNVKKVAVEGTLPSPIAEYIARGGEEEKTPKHKDGQHRKRITGDSYDLVGLCGTVKLV